MWVQKLRVFYDFSYVELYPSEPLTSTIASDGVLVLVSLASSVGSVATLEIRVEQSRRLRHLAAWA